MSGKKSNDPAAYASHIHHSWQILATRDQHKSTISYLPLLLGNTFIMNI